MKWLICVLLPFQLTPANEWGFIGAQEEFVIKSIDTRIAYNALPESQRSVIMSMSESDYRHREWASREMRKMGFSALHACFVGQTLRDPEVRLRCRNVLRTISKCSMCDGQGGRVESWGSIICGTCNGVGHFLPVDEF